MKRFLKPLAYLLVIIAVLFSLNTNMLYKNTSNITYSEFIEKAKYGDFEKVVIVGDEIRAYPYDSDKYYTTQYIEDKDFVNFLTEQEISVERQEEKNNNAFSMIFSLLISFAPWLLLMWYMNRMMGGNSEEGAGGLNMIFGAGKNKSKMYKENDTGVKFDDVAGQEEAKESLTEIIDYLHNADKYNSIGAKLPKGALLIGPPGTGKTLLAKAVAGEAGVPFFSITGSHFVEMFVGVGASRVRDLFEEAKRNSPCIIFIDEIDAIGKSRSSGARTGSNDEREQTLNQLLAEMDGFEADTAIVVLAATNRPEILDKALTRPGRFDRRVIVDRPDLKGREDILKVHSKNVHMDETVDLKAIAQATAGAVGADLANIVNEAALRAVKMKRDNVSQEDVMESVELVFAGKEKKDRVMTEKERKIVAYHEVGHAVVAALQKNSSPVQKITIVPRTTGSLGYTMQVPEEERYLSTKEEMMEEIRTIIGGRCAEEVFFNTITTGASNDIEKVTELVRKMITTYGMNDKFDMIAFETTQSYYLEDSPFRNCSEEFSAIIDSEMVRIVKTCHIEVKKMLNDNIDLIHEVAGVLLEKENITGDEFMSIFRKYHNAEYSWTPTISVDDVEIPTYNKPVINTMKESLYDDLKPVKKEVVKKQVEEKKNETTKQDTEVNSLNKKDDKKSVVKNDEENIDKKQSSAKDDKKDSVAENKNTNTEQEINIDENIFEEPPQIEDFQSLVEEQGQPVNIEEPPMPDFDFPFDDEPQESTQKKSETQKTDNKESDDNAVKEKKPAFEAPKPLQKKKKKKPVKTEQVADKKEEDSKKEDKKDDKPELSSEPTEKKGNDLDLLMSSLKENPSELAKKKGGKYISQQNNKKKDTGILSPDSNADEVKNKLVETSSNEVTEDDY